MQRIKKTALTLLTMLLISCNSTQTIKPPELPFPDVPAPQIISKSGTNITITADYYIALAKYVIDVKLCEQLYSNYRYIAK